MIKEKEAMVVTSQASEGVSLPIMPSRYWKEDTKER
jgi:hypothetical protein